MTEADSFQARLLRVRGGDRAAAIELIWQYREEIRRFIRRRFTDRQLRRLYDSEDIWQSVATAFMGWALKHDLAVQRHEELLKILAKIALRNVQMKVRRYRTARRDLRRDGGAEEAAGVPDRGPSPDQAAEQRELAEKIRRRLPEEARLILQARHLGRSWKDISQELGLPVDTVRKRLTAAIVRVRRGLDQKEDDHA